MKPYYQDDHATIYHADARELLPQLVFDVVVTDPPYGIDIAKNGSIGGEGSAKLKNYKPVIGDDEPLDPTWLAGFGERQIIFGVSHFVNIPHAGRLLVWDKKDGGSKDTFADVEVAWDSKRGKSEIIRHRQRGFICNFGDISKKHPTQKPLSVMLWIIDNCTEPEQTIIDPFMGSGSTLRAAKDLNRKSIGIEIDEQYCEIAARRLAQEVLPL